jgi:cell division protein FtsB
MNVDLGIWGKLTNVVVFLLLLAGVLYVGLWYLPLIKQNERMRREVLRLETKAQHERDINKQLKAATENLQKNPKAVERLAREELGYGKPDETLIIFKKPVTNQIVPEPPPAR